MSMLNQVAMEALCAANYLENYLLCVDKLPDDIQRIVTQLRELDMQTNEMLAKIAAQKDIWLKQEDAQSSQKKSSATVQELHRILVRTREMGDLKLALVAQIIELIEEQSRQLEQDLENLDPSSTATSIVREEDAGYVHGGPKSSSVSSSTNVAVAAVPVASATVAECSVTSTTSTPVTKPAKHDEKSDTAKRHRRRVTQQQEPSVAAVITAVVEDEKKSEDERPRKKKAKREKIEKSPMTKLAIDPDEPKYCLCNQISYGEMIGCDNQHCTLEWFHFNCVNLVHKPKGKWYCPRCRGDRPTVMSQELQEQLRKEKPNKKSFD